MILAIANKKEVGAGRTNLDKYISLTMCAKRITFKCKVKINIRQCQAFSFFFWILTLKPS